MSRLRDRRATDPWDAPRPISPLSLYSSRHRIRLPPHDSKSAVAPKIRRAAPC